MGRAEPGGAQARRALEVISRQTQQLARLVDDLLDVTRVARNKIVLQRRPVDLVELARRTVEDHSTLFKANSVALELHLAGRPVEVDADEARLAQVLGNLLQNAAKFTPGGGHVTVSVDGSAAPGRAVFAIKDTGTGIPPSMMRQLFQPFMQADTTLDRSKGGLGLGLAFAKGIVDLHGGAIRAHSDGVGCGAEFVVELPLAAGGSDARESRDPAPDGPRQRVLIIEDNVDAARSLREVLELNGHCAEVAFDGPAGLAAARAFKPDVVLCDIGLPGMSGYEVARAFRADEELKRAVLIAVSGYGLPEDLQRAAEAGFSRHVAKPPTAEKLEAVLAETAR